MDTRRCDELLERAVADGALPGAVAVVVDAGGVVHTAAAGTAPDTLFQIMSMTKAVATVGALQLVEQGRLDLDAEVRSILPEFGELQVLEGFDGDTPRLRPPATQATIRQLMTHTSGCGYFITNADLNRWHQVAGVPTILEGRKASLRAPLVRDPGTLWEYGVSVDWLAQVLEAVSGHTLGDYLAEHVFGPLEMASATFHPTPEQRAGFMAVHARTPDGGLVATEVALPLEQEFDAGGHGCCMSAGDYGRFLAALLGGGVLDGARILAPETVELALSDHLRGAAMPEMLRSAVPALINDVPILPVKQGWGLGFHLTLEDLDGMRHAGTGDWAGLFNCFYWLDRRAGIAGALLTQVIPFFDAACVQTALGFEQAVYAEVGADTCV